MFRPRGFENPGKTPAAPGSPAPGRPEMPASFGVSTTWGLTPGLQCRGPCPCPRRGRPPFERASGGFIPTHAIEGRKGFARSARCDGCPDRGGNSPARGNALGNRVRTIHPALKGRHSVWQTSASAMGVSDCALSGRGGFGAPESCGVAPGWRMGCAFGRGMGPWDRGTSKGAFPLYRPGFRDRSEMPFSLRFLGAEHVGNGAELSGMSKTQMRRRQSACRVVLPRAGFPAFPSVVPPSDAGFQKATSRDRAKSPAPLARHHGCGPASTGSS